MSLITRRPAIDFAPHNGDADFRRFLDKLPAVPYICDAALKGLLSNVTSEALKRT